MAAEEEHATHAWSEGASRGAHTLKLDSLADGQTRLVNCSPLRDNASGAPISRETDAVLSGPSMHSPQIMSIVSGLE